MRLHFIIILCSQLLLSKNIFGQVFSYQSKLTLVCKEQPLRTVINEISDKTDLKFIYTDDLVNCKFVTCDFKNILIEDILSSIMKKVNLSYNVFKEKFIILSKNNIRHHNIMGQVVDSVSLETLPYANVQIKNTIRGGVSDKNGYFSLKCTPAELCTLLVNYIGYSPKEVVTDLYNETDSLIICMKERALTTEPIYVCDTRIHNIEVTCDANTIKYNPQKTDFFPTIANNDIHHTLQLMPGVKNIFDYLDGLYIQGGTPDQNYVLFDGIPVLRAEHLWGYMNSFNPNAISEIKLYKAGFPAIFGGKLSSVVELKGHSDVERFNFGIGIDFFSANYHLKFPIGSKFNAAFTYRHSFPKISMNDMYYNAEDYLFLLKRRYIADLDHGNMFKFSDCTSKLNYQFSSDHKLSLTAFSTFDKVDIANKETLNDIKQGERYEKWSNFGIGLNWTKNWNFTNNSVVHLSLTNYDNQYLYTAQLFGSLSLQLPDGRIVGWERYCIDVEELDHFEVSQVNFNINTLFNFGHFIQLIWVIH